jgi:hypothetical protein
MTEVNRDNLDKQLEAAAFDEGALISVRKAVILKSAAKLVSQPRPDMKAILWDLEAFGVVSREDAVSSHQVPGIIANALKEEEASALRIANASFQYRDQALSDIAAPQEPLF